MNNKITSREEILEVCRKIVSENGLASLNMREVARQCQVALGTIYYYFSSKDDLVISIIESVWENIFSFKEIGDNGIAFPDYLMILFQKILNGIEAYPNFLTLHALSFASSGNDQAKDTMARFLIKIKEELLQAIILDEKVRKDAFSDDFNESRFTDFVLSNIMILVMQRQKDCNTLMEIVRRAIY
ncbi:MAG: TetR/AcrR family transcriptional regulator [Tissierellia bacterium]|nr:TetR/AcrR family transcriptional regulator [Tissierellia bacterium]